MHYFLMAILDTDPSHGVLWQTVAKPPACGVSSRRRETWSPATDEARPPCVCAGVVVTTRRLARDPDQVF
jgi:hypothetical protein